MEDEFERRLSKIIKKHKNQRISDNFWEGHLNGLETALDGYTKYCKADIKIQILKEFLSDEQLHSILGNTNRGDIASIIGKEINRRDGEKICADCKHTKSDHHYVDRHNTPCTACECKNYKEVL